MKISRGPMVTTIGLGLFFGLLFIPLSMILSTVISWPQTFRLIIWGYVAIYAVFLARWGRGTSTGLLFPLVLLLVLAFWGIPRVDFLLVALVCLSWIRSGICFKRPLLRMLAAEMIICLGGGALVAFLAPYSTLSWAMGIWLFFLIQSLYFVLFERTAEKAEEMIAADPFDQARKQAERILSNSVQ